MIDIVYVAVFSFVLYFHNTHATCFTLFHKPTLGVNTKSKKASQCTGSTEEDCKLANLNVNNTGFKILRQYSIKDGAC